MVAHQKRKKSCVKKSRVVSAVPGSNKVVVFCVHGCGISYTTVPMHVDKPAWHKTLRKLNAHESQRCPKNAACQRCPRKHPRVRASSTANPVVAAANMHMQTKARKLITHSVPPAPPVPSHKNLAEAAAESSLRDYALAADEDFWGCGLENVGAELEAQELEGRLSEESQLLLDPSSEASVVTGVYWTQPTENRDDASDAYKAEVLRRLSEPATAEEIRRRAAHDFVRRVFPEFQAKLERMRERGNLSGCWGGGSTAATRVKRGAPLTSASASASASASSSSSSSSAALSSSPPSASPAPANVSEKKRQRYDPAPASPAGPVGQIDLPDFLTLKAIPWGLGQQVAVHSAADGGRCDAHIVGIGGYQGSSVLLQFFSPDGSLRQQLHDSSGVTEGERTRGCVFDESTKISEFAVQQLSDVTTTTNNNSSSRCCPAGTAGRKLAPLQCDDLLASLDEADAKFDDVFGPFVADGATTDLEVSPDFAALFSTAPTSARADPADIFGDFDSLTDDDEAEEEEEELGDDEVELREFTSAMRAIEITPTTMALQSKTLERSRSRVRVKRPSITDFLKMELAATMSPHASSILPSWAVCEEEACLLSNDCEHLFGVDAMVFHD